MLKREQEQLLNTLAQAWGSMPQLRLGQLIINSQTAGSKIPKDLFYVLDEELRLNVSSFANTYRTVGEV